MLFSSILLKIKFEGFNNFKLFEGFVIKLNSIKYKNLISKRFQKKPLKNSGFVVCLFNSKEATK